ncbi:RNA methyltransferase [Acidobacteria bacterium ACD]|nr:MAG: hypothetical protein EDX89_05235 [Acidobacteriota bacterium]MDL1951038.1 RNA methyltransferase [Acidobacteria bacterium ACD]
MPVTLVLVRTHSHGNLGSCARTARALGAGLVLVAPVADRAHPDASAFASGADELLAAAPVVEGLEAVETGHDLLVALTSLRGRRERGLPARTTVAAVRREAGAGRRVALVLGPERGGLTREELVRCGSRLTLPTRSDFPTLALPQAAAAALALLVAGRAAPGGATQEERASAAEVTRLVATLASELAAAGFVESNGTAVAELAALLRRSRPTSREVGLALGALSALRRRPED